MDEEPQIPRPDKLPSISSPVDSMSTGSTTNQPLTNAGTEAVLPGRVGSDVTQSPKLPIIPPLSLYGDADDGVEDEEPKYERKGAFWLKKDKGPEEFRFPKPLSHPEPLWSPGDGFSVDEARPSLAFGMTGSQKQRKPKPTPGVGELQLETRDEDKGQARGSRISRRNNRRLDQYEMKHRRDVPKDIWPTVDNFSEELKVQKRNPTVLASEKTIPSTMPPQPTPVPQLRETFSYNLPLMPRQRGHEDFENFGRHLSNNNEMSDICVSETQINPADDAAQPEPAGDESFYGTEEEYEIEWEEESDNEHVIFPWHNEEPDGMGECEFSNEEVTFCDTPNSESTLDYIEHAVQELEHIGNLLGVGDVAREEAFDFSS